MLFRLLLIAVILFAGYKFATGAISNAQTALRQTFAWMYEDY